MEGTDLDEETRRKIEKNRLEALERLKERKRRLEQEHSTFNATNQPNNPIIEVERNNISASTSNTKNTLNNNKFVTTNNSSVSALIPTTSIVNRSLDDSITIQRTIPDTFSKPLPTKFVKLEASVKLAGNSNSIAVRVVTQLISSNTFSITATSSVQTICRKILTEVTFNRVDNTYTVPLGRYNFIVDALPVNEKPQIQQQIPKSILNAFENGQVAQRKTAMNMDYRIESVIGRELYNSLFPYQREGVKMAIARRGRLILADEMGLGKSIQAIATAVYFRREWPLLILAPASMVASWHQQLLRWISEEVLSPSEIQVIYDGKVRSIDGTVVILSYDLSVKLSDLIQNRGFRVIIADECHALRNIDTKRSKRLIPIISAAERALLLSGTPALSRPIELFPQIQAINPKLFPKRHDFALRYCDAHKSYYGGWDMRGSANLTELQIILENCVMIRRMKDQVLTELPPKIRRQVFLKLPTATKNYKMFQMQTTEYLSKLGCESLSDNSEISLAGLESMQKKAEFMALWKRTGEIKLDSMIEYVEDLLDSNHKMLIFAHHTSILDGFASNFISKKIKYIRIDGKTPPSQRQDICTSFQENEEIRVALLSITAASTGLTLTKATTVIFSELFFNPGVLVQAEDRAHRIGQLDSVNVHYLLAKGTTDDQIWPLILKKLNTLESVGLGKNDFKDISAREHDQGQLTIDKFFKTEQSINMKKEDEEQEYCFNDNDNYVYDNNDNNLKTNYVYDLTD